MNKLINIAFQIQNANPNALLGGSIALCLQGVQTAREPKDIDICMPYGDHFIMIDGMEEYFEKNEGSDDYINDEYDRTSYKIGDVQVDVFTPVTDKITVRSTYAHYNPTERQAIAVVCVHKSDIIRQKALYALANHSSCFKHAKDLVFIFDQITKFEKIA